MDAVTDLENAGCVEVDPEGDKLRPATLGRVASYYYLKYTTVAVFHAELHDVEEGPRDLPTLLRVLCDASEFDQLPVRHNGDTSGIRTHATTALEACVVPKVSTTLSISCLRHKLAWCRLTGFESRVAAEEHVNLTLSKDLPWKVD